MSKIYLLYINIQESKNEVTTLSYKNDSFVNIENIFNRNVRTFVYIKITIDQHNEWYNASIITSPVDFVFKCIRKIFFQIF